MQALYQLSYSPEADHDTSGFSRFSLSGVVPTRKFVVGSGRAGTLAGP
jgi:hypothetical protein